MKVHQNKTVGDMHIRRKMEKKYFEMKITSHTTTDSIRVSFCLVCCCHISIPLLIKYHEAIKLH